MGYTGALHQQFFWKRSGNWFFLINAIDLDHCILIISHENFQKEKSIMKKLFILPFFAIVLLG
jgi:hypothetical protein